MAESIIFPLPDGATYTIPDVGDEDWGQNVTDFLIAIPAGVPPRNGTFSLTGDLSFGPSFGIVSAYYKSRTANIATAGVLRLAKTDTIDWRNNANSADLALGIDGSDQLTFNGVAVTSGVTSITGTANQIIASSPTGAITLSTPQNIGTGSAPTFAAMTLTSGSAPQSSIIGIGVTTANLLLEANALSNKITTDSLGNFSITDTDNSHSLLSYSRSGKTVQIYNLVPIVGSLATSGTVTPDATVASTFEVTLSGNLVINGPTNPTDGQKIIFELQQSGTSHTVTFNTGAGNFRFGSDIPSFTASLTPGLDYVGAIYSATAGVWDIVSVVQGFGGGGSGGGSGITQLTGDVTAGPGSGSQVATLATVNSNVGVFTNATVTVNAKGLVTAATSGSSGSGLLLQFAFAKTTSSTSTTSATYVTTGLSMSFTASATHTIRITVSGPMAFSAAGFRTWFTITRDGSDLGAGNYMEVVALDTAIGDIPVAFSWVDTAPNVSAHTYALAFRTEGPNTAVFNAAGGWATMTIEEYNL